jgi:hypothetical protein
MTKSSGNYKAIVKENDNGRSYIVFELLRGSEITDFKNAIFGFEFDSKCSYEDVQNIASTINKSIVNIFFQTNESTY